MTWLLLLPVALAAGMAAPTQFAINSQLRQVVGGRILAAALSRAYPAFWGPAHHSRGRFGPEVLSLQRGSKPHCKLVSF
jgi:hypothetical protein